MFGHQDENDQDNQAPAEPQADATLSAGDAAPAVEDHEVDEALKALAAHATPGEDGSEPQVDVVTPTVSSENHDANDNTRAVADPGRADSANDNPDSSKLLDLKQDALQQLTPLLDKLDQTPEEKFRTTMMMIQAADNQTLLPTAYSAAQAISDEKLKAQALLDIVNEINYFTQQSEA